MVYWIIFLCIFCITIFSCIGSIILIIKDYYGFKKILKQAEEINDLFEKVIKETIETYKMMR